MLPHDTQTAGGPSAHRGPSAVSRPRTVQESPRPSPTVLKSAKNARFGGRRTSAHARSDALLPCDTWPAGGPRPSRAPTAIARTCAVKDSCCCLEPY